MPNFGLHKGLLVIPLLNGPPKPEACLVADTHSEGHQQHDGIVGFTYIFNKNISYYIDGLSFSTCG